MESNLDEPERLEVIDEPMENVRQDEIVEIEDKIEDHKTETTGVENRNKDDESKGNEEDRIKGVEETNDMMKVQE